MIASMKPALKRLKHHYNKWTGFLLHSIALYLSKTTLGNSAYPIFHKHGFHLIRRNYEVPLPEPEDLGFLKSSDLVGINMRDEAQLAFMENVIAPYKAEINAFPAHETADPQQFYMVNGSYMAIDSHVYYALIRTHKPQRIVEIGSGNSTLLAAAAIRQNLKEAASPTTLISIEPYPADKLKKIPELSQLIQKKVQAVDLAVFQQLQAGDLLFIDSSHAFSAASDVWWEFCEILPRLAPGVFVHIHDISLPKPYPQVYLDTQRFWNEQYVLQTFLTYNSRFEVVWAGNYMMTQYPEKMAEFFAPGYQQMQDQFPFSEPSAFWMRVMG